MRQPEFDAFFARLALQLPVSLIARVTPEPVYSNPIKCSSLMSVWDAMDLLEEADALLLPDGKVALRKNFLKRPIRILFFILLTEIESKLYRVAEWSNHHVDDLNEKNLNDLIRWLVEQEELLSKQSIYHLRSEFKDDLKSMSSFRNLMVHVNKKLELATDFTTLIKRKKQCLKLLDALSMMLDWQEFEQKVVVVHAP